MTEQFHAKGLGPARYLQAHAAQAEDAQLLAPQFGALQRLLFPLAGVQQSVGAGQLTAQRKHQPDSQLSHGNGVGARCVHHHDAAPRGGIGVDVVDPHPGASNHSQLRSRLQQGIIHLNRGTNYEPVRIRQFSGQPLLDLIVGHNLPTALALQYCQGGGRDLLCQYDLHRTPKDFWSPLRLLLARAGSSREGTV